MSVRFLASFSALLLMIAAPLPDQTQPAGARAETRTIPRTPDGHPDLQGIWTNATGARHRSGEESLIKRAEPPSNPQSAR